MIGTPGRRLPLTSLAEAISVTLPPAAGTVAELDESDTVSTAAPPILIVATFDVVLVAELPDPDVVVVPPAPPDVAEILASPDVLPAMNFTMARPPCVSASDG